MRLIKGLQGLKSYRNATRALLVWWFQGKDNEFHHLEHSPQTPVSLRSVFPDDWSRILGLQFLMSDYSDESDDETSGIRSTNENSDDAPHHTERDVGQSVPSDKDTESFYTPDQSSGFRTPDNYFVHDQMNPELLQACMVATHSCMADGDEYVSDPSVLEPSLRTKCDEDAVTYRYSSGPIPEHYHYHVANPVSYTHLTLPTKA